MKRTFSKPLDIYGVIGPIPAIQDHVKKLKTEVQVKMMSEEDAPAAECPELSLE